MTDPVAHLFAELGEPLLRKVVGAFYQRVRKDTLIGPMYPPDDWENAEKRLADFLVFRFGGPPLYLQERGHPRLRARHFPFPIDTAARDRWLLLMNEAMDECEVADTSQEPMRAFFAQVADAMRNREG